MPAFSRGVLFKLPFSNTVPFLTALFFLLLADALMAYIFPIYVEETLGSATVMGIVMALSSIAGIVCDIIFPHFFQPQTWKKQWILGAMVAIFFPLLTYWGIISSNMLLFALASVMWGIYYELVFFAQQNYVVDQSTKSQFSRVWSVITVTFTTAYVIGPIFAAQYLTRPLILMWYVLGATGLSLIAILFARSKKVSAQAAPAEQLNPLTFIRELKAWAILWPRIHPVVITGFLAKAIDATFWTIGALFGYMLFAQNLSYAWLPIFAYQVMSYLGSLIIMRLAITDHKKWWSEWTLVATGLLLMLFVFAQNLWILLPLISIVGALVTVILTLNNAVYSDLIQRAEGFGEDIVGLSQTNSSMAYIIMPLVMGFLVDRVGFYWSFASLGCVVVAAALVLLMITPRKLRLPQQQLR